MIVVKSVIAYGAPPRSRVIIPRTASRWALKRSVAPSASTGGRRTGNFPGSGQGP